MIVWRIEKRKRVAGARTGEGAKLWGGRWNSPGVPVIYASEHLALAILEILVHAPEPAMRTVPRARARITVPEAAIEVVEPSRLPRDFGPQTSASVTQAIGDDWLQSRRTPALLVPSAIVPQENNLLLNPLHRDFSQLVWSEFEPISLDPRLWAVGK